MITPKDCTIASCPLTILCVRRTSCVKPLGYNHFPMSTMTRAAEPVRADFERREPRCRICRDETVRVWSMSCWTGAVSRAIWAGGKTHRITLTEILRFLEPINEGRDKRDRITYDALWVHFQRHDRLAGRTARLENPDVQGVQEVQAALRG